MENIQDVLNVNDPNPIEFYSYIQEGKIYYILINLQALKYGLKIKKEKMM